MTSITKCVQLCSAEQLAMLQLQNEGCVCREHVLTQEHWVITQHSTCTGPELKQVNKLINGRKHFKNVHTACKINKTTSREISVQITQTQHYPVRWLKNWKKCLATNLLLSSESWAT